MAAQPASGGGGNQQMTLDATKFMSYLKDLQEAFRPPTTLAKIMESEMLAVMKGAARRTGRTTKNKAGGKYNPGSKYYKGWVKMNGKKYYCGPTKNGLKGFRYSDSMWAKLQARLKMNRKRAETRVGLSKAVYYEASARLKLPRYGSGWEKEVTTSRNESGGMGKAAKDGPQWPQTVQATKNLRGNNPKMSANFTSTNTFNPFTKGKGALKSAMAARGKNFETAVEKGAFKTAKRLAGFYPGINVSL